MLFEVLTQQILAVVVAIRRAHDRVDVLPRGNARRQLSQHTDGTLVVELDQDDGALDPVIEHGVRVASADPCEVRIVQV